MGISTYEVVLALHVAMAVAWLGSVLAFEVLGERQRRREDAQEALVFARDHAFFARAIALPGSVVLLLSGGWLMQEAGFELEEAWWIGAAIGIWIVAFLGSTMLRGPRLARAVSLAAAEGAESEEVRWRIRQVRLITRGELALLTVALLLMVLQPS